ncbi:MAG TPA: hypothetical protein VN380_02405 [Thermoanaerobaculia bacterium]|jgi:hypothetical protein|nr:hypothetical protein [Thermoanaerobaculia bacterium]
MTEATRVDNRNLGKTVRLVANPGAKITPDVVHAAFAQIFRLNGCLACGLLGIDVVIHGGDPEPLLDNVQGFSGTVR